MLELCIRKLTVGIGSVATANFAELREVFSTFLSLIRIFVCLVIFGVISYNQRPCYINVSLFLFLSFYNVPLQLNLPQKS